MHSSHTRKNGVKLKRERKRKMTKRLIEIKKFREVDTSKMVVRNREKFC